MNKNYQKRMNQTMVDKIDILKKYIKSNDTVLDFGCGSSTQIRDVVESLGGRYIGVDTNPDVQKVFGQTKIYESIEEVQEKYDIVFMSSVIHELFSYLSEAKRENLFKRLIDKLSPNGKIIIRDFYIYENDNMTSHLTIRPERVEVKIWYNALLKNNIIKPMSITNRIVGNHLDVYEMLYHTVWGLQSLEHESCERYSISETALLKLIPLNIIESSTYFDKGYLQHMDKYFVVEDRFILDYPSKTILVFEKSEG